MDTFPDELLLKIIQRISLFDKFKLTRVNRQWFRVCRESLFNQEVVGLESTPKIPLPPKKTVPSSCVEGLLSHGLFPEDILQVNAKYLTLQLDSLAQCSNLKIISIGWLRNNEEPYRVIQFCLRTWGKQLECFSCRVSSYDYRESLPRLKHLNVWQITAEAMEGILKNSPNIKGFQIQGMDEMQVRKMPRGLAVFNIDSSMSNMEDIFVSPAAETLEHLDMIKLEPLETGQFYLPNLRKISVQVTGIKQPRDFLSSLSLSSSLEEFNLHVCYATFWKDDDWNNFFSTKRKLKKLLTPSLRHGSIDSLVESCPLLQNLILFECFLSNKSLVILSKLKHLAVLHVRNSSEYHPNKLTAKGILAFLKGDNRYKLRQLSIESDDSYETGYLTREVRLQLRELYFGKSLENVTISCNERCEHDYRLPNPRIRGMPRLLLWCPNYCHHTID